MGRPRSQFNYILVLTFSDVHLKYQKCGRPPYHNSLNIPSDEHCCLLFHFLFVSLRGETSNSHGIHHSKWRTMPPNFGTVETCDVVKTKRNDPWPMTGNGNHTTCQNGHDWGMVQMALPTCAVFWLKNSPWLRIPPHAGHASTENTRCLWGRRCLGPTALLRRQEERTSREKKNLRS